ncbi:MAG TPA: DUF4863 family protein [Candidatus Desulfobacillus sp.]|nr:DUF4863 family protein [Candidatus Desulfobacillus sp.]
MENATIESFIPLVEEITRAIAGRPLDEKLEQHLNSTFPAGGAAFERIFAACKAGIAAGWMCEREAGGIKFGRVAKPSDALAGFSIDVVEMDSVKGPHHRHTNGEIDMIMPLDAEARFDGRGRGWLVYPAGHAHHPTVTGGKAIVLYLLPGGAIEFTRS